MTRYRSVRTTSAIALGLLMGASLARPQVDTPVATLEPVGAALVQPPEVCQVETLIARRAPGLDEDLRWKLASAIVEEAARANLSPLKLLAVISVESSFDEDARSNRGAHGLMQVRAPTRNAMAEKEGLMTCDDDPVANVRLGARYLGLLKRQFKGREALALMAYNAGPQRLVASFATRDTERFMPYVNAVEREFKRLRRLTGDRDLLALASRVP